MRNLRCIACTGLALALAACAVDPGPDTAHEEHAISLGADDADTPQANVVIALAPNENGAPFCTGTLISPIAVLTAKHCVAGGTDGSGPKAFPLTVVIGDPLHGARTARRPAIGATTYFGNMTPLTTDEIGGDLAIVWLDRPVADLDVDIRRPSLTAPTAYGDDSEGGTYPVWLGSAGWSPFSSHDPELRQVGWFNEIYHYPGWPDDPPGQIWIRGPMSFQAEAGDSGGPLFVETEGHRDVIGVLSGGGRLPYGVDGDDCTYTDCTVWTDITRGHPADFVRETMQDDRSSIWRIRHGLTSHWRGEVDYLGGCRFDRDADCDHWYDEHDNCPVTPNWNQEDADDDGLGDACPDERPFGGWQLISIEGFFPDLAASKDHDGILHFFLRRGDYAVMDAKDEPWGGFLQPPVPLGGVAWYRPAAAQNADGRAEVFVAQAGLANKWEYFTSTGTAWSWGWNDLNQLVSSAPAAIAGADGSLHVFARGLAGDVVHARQWSGWRFESLGGVIQGTPAVERNRDGRLEVVVRGTDDALYHAWELYPGGPWSVFAPLSGGMTSDPVAARLPGGEIQVFVRGGDGAIWTRLQTISGWSGWQSLGGWSAGTPAVALANTGLAVFVRGGDDHLYRNVRVKNQPFQWRGWEDLGGDLGGDPVAGRRADGGLVIAAINTVGDLIDLRQD